MSLVPTVRSPVRCVLVQPYGTIPARYPLVLDPCQPTANCQLEGAPHWRPSDLVVHSGFPGSVVSTCSRIAPDPRAIDESRGNTNAGLAEQHVVNKSNPSCNREAGTEYSPTTTGQKWKMVWHPLRRGLASDTSRSDLISRNTRSSNKKSPSTWPDRYF